MDHNQEFLGVDVGAARVGIARGSSLAKLAEPLKTIAADKAVAELNDLAKANSAAGIVVGLPRNLDGDETAQTQTVRAWAASAQTQISLPFYWQDEALTSQKAIDKNQNAKNQADEHGLAAALILQDFLDTPKDQRVRC